MDVIPSGIKFEVLVHTVERHIADLLRERQAKKREEPVTAG
jgi:hypothetical protein